MLVLNNNKFRHVVATWVSPCTLVFSPSKVCDYMESMFFNNDLQKIVIECEIIPFFPAQCTYTEEVLKYYGCFHYETMLYYRSIIPE